MSRNGTEKVDRVLNGILSLKMKYFLAGASKSLKKFEIFEKNDRLPKKSDSPV